MAVNIPIRYVTDKGALNQAVRDWKDIRKEVTGYDKDVSGASRSTGEIQTQTGGLKNALGGVAKAAGALGVALTFAEGIRALATLINQTQKLRSEVTQLTGASGANLDTLTGQIQALAQVYDIEFREVLIASNTVAKEFATTQSAALAEIERGLREGANANGEYLDILREYPSQLARAGVSLKNFTDISILAAREGIYSDKGIDTIKEAQLALSELTKPTVDALEAIGLSATEIEKSIADGSKSIFDVIQLVSRRLAELPPQSKEVGMALADIFKGAGEDAGIRYITLLGDIDGALGDVSAESAQYQQVLADQVAAQAALNTELSRFSSNFSSLGREIATFVSGPATGLLKFFNDFIDSFSGYQGEAERFGQTITENLNTDQVNAGLARTRQQIELLTEAQKKARNPEELTAAIEKEKQNEEELLAILRSYEGAYDAKQSAAKKAATESIKATKTQTTEEIAEAKKRQEELDKITLEGIRKRNTLAPPENAQQEVRLRQDANLDEQGQAKFIPIVDEAKLGDVTQAFEDAEERRVQANQEANDKIVAAAELTAQRRAAIAAGAVDALIQIGNIYADFQANRNDRELARVEEVEEAKLAIVGDNEQAQNAIRAEAEEQRKQILREQARIDKRVAIFQSIINTGAAVVRALATGGPILAGITAALGVAQTALIASTPIPAFRQGTKSVPGNMANRDSVLSFVDPGEMIVPRERTAQYRPALNAIFDGKISPEAINNFVINSGGTQGGIDDVKLAKAIAREVAAIPQPRISIDRRGFQAYTSNQITNIRKDNKEFTR
jgi:hypothetical protein